MLRLTQSETIQVLLWLVLVKYIKINKSPRPQSFDKHAETETLEDLLRSGRRPKDQDVKLNLLLDCEKNHHMPT